MTEIKRYGSSAAKADEREITEDDVWADAYRIAEPGAVNPTAVAATLAACSSALVRQYGTAEARKHPALRAMAGQLAMLFGVDKWGADVLDYDAVVRKAEALGIATDSTVEHRKISLSARSR